MKEIIVNVGERETRIAVMEEQKLVELHIERSERVIGSIYKCRVANVLPGMDAAFVDIGLDRNAFLYVGDVLPIEGESHNGNHRGRSEETFGTSDARTEANRISFPDDEELADADESIDAMQIQEAINEAELDGEIELIESMDTVSEPLVPMEDNALDPTAQKVVPPAARRRQDYRRSTLRQQRIKDVLKVGQERLVQVIKGPRSTKGARVSTRISLPGRYLVLMPEADHLGVSRKIEDSRERDRLKKIGEKLRVPGVGIIIRTEAEEKTEQELRHDMEFLLQTWREIANKAQNSPAPALIQQDLTLLYKTIRDIFGSDVQKLVIDNPAEFEKANELIERLSPKLKGRVQLYDGAKPVFDEFKIEEELERLTRRKVPLRSGGYLVIDETEALTVIDINTGKFTGGGSLSETIVRTNIEAATEIARQLRLRDIGGIIVIDFIDMNNPKDKQSVLKQLELALKKDRSRTKISNISPLGLVEMTRKRTGETLTAFITDECPNCKGRGHLPTAESVSLELERVVRKAATDPKMAKKEALLVTCHPDVAELFIGPDGLSIQELERELERALYVRANADTHIEKYTIEAGEIADYDKSRQNCRRSQVVDCIVARSLLKEQNRCIGWAEGMLLDLDDGQKFIGQKVRARITSVRRSHAVAQIVSGSNR